MTANDHCRTLLAAIIPDRSDLLGYAQRHLSAAHFPDRTLGNLFVILERYSDVTGGAVATRQAVVDSLTRNRVDAGTIASYAETFDLLLSTPADEAQFRWSLTQIRELAAERATGEALTQSMEILTRGRQDEHGEDVRGHLEARTHALSRFAEIDRDLAMQDAPEGNMRGEGDDIMADYASRKAARERGRSVGVEFGIPPLDAKIGGLQNGELVLIVGYTSEGKTSMVVNLTWNAVVNQGKNVVFLTTETPRTQVRRRLIARHSTHELFDNPDGLNSRDLKNGTFNPEQERMLARVVADFDHNPGYGTCWISQVPRGATMGYIESKLTRLQRMFNIDLAVMDYFALLKPDRRRNSDREELGSILKEAKQVCTTFADGIGIPLVSPWQVSRSARTEAERTGFYTPSALSDTSEASNSADIIVTLLAPLDNESRRARLKMQAMKNRDGERAHSLQVDVDYATNRFSVESGSSSRVDAMFTGPDDLYS